MELILIGTPVCGKCKSASAKLSTYCEEHDIDYSYMNLGDAPPSIVKLLLAANVKQAPALIRREGECLESIYSGDEALAEVDNIMKNS